MRPGVKSSLPIIGFEATGVGVLLTPPVPPVLFELPACGSDAAPPEHPIISIIASIITILFFIYSQLSM
jgi:hypothetical protein